MSNVVRAHRSGKELTAIVNGQSFYVTSETSEEAIALYKEVLAYKADGSDQAMEDLKKMLSPGYKVGVDLKGVIQRDRTGNYYLSGYDRPLPAKLLETFKEHIEHDIPMEGLINFWKLLMLNPNEDVKDDLFKFADRFRMPITDNGYFIAYKSVAWKGEKDKDLGVFISQQYVSKKGSGRSTDGLLVIKLSENEYQVDTQEVYDAMVEDHLESYIDLKKRDLVEEWLKDNEFAKWKVAQYSLNSPEEVLQFAEDLGYVQMSDTVIKDLMLEDLEWEILGTLEECFRNISTMFDFDSPTFTDWHTQRSTIVLGEPVSMPMEDVDTNRHNTCSSGLHVGAPGYVSRFGHGDSNYIIACLVNPMNVGAVPVDYSYEKMRVAEYLPYAICEFEKGAIKELDTNYFEEDYINFEKELLENKLGELDMNEEGAEEKRKLISDRLVVLG